MRSAYIKNELVIIFFITISLLSLRWTLSFINFPNEDIILRTIFEINDTSYFPLIKSFSNFDFNPSFSLDIEDLNITSFPILSLLPNILFYKIFGSYSFIIIEFLSVFIFLLVFYKIFCLINISKTSSILFSLILFSIPFIINQLSFLNNSLINQISLNFSTFYDLRNPRPLISNLYLFSYLYFLINFFYLKQRKTSTFIIIALIIGLSLHTFFYFFIFEIFLLLILYLFFFKKKILSFIKYKFKAHVIFFLIIIFFCFLFILQLNLSELEYRQRMGIFYMDTDKKRIIINYLVNFFMQIEFVFILIINTLLFIFFKNKFFKFFYYLFISIIISTITFILFSPNSIDYYHFFNWILVSGTIPLLILIFIFIENSLFNLVTSHVKRSIIISSVILLIINFNFSYNFQTKNKNDKSRESLAELVTFIKNEKVFSKNDNKILTFNHGIFMWLHLNGHTNFSIVPNSFWTPKKTSVIENELIGSFKSLALSSEDFVLFFKNKKKGYRYSNSNTKKFFDRLYLANKLKTYSNIDNFNLDHRSFIEVSSPLYSHQSIIPSNEFERFKTKFDVTENFVNSDVIILDNKDQIINKHILNKDIYCLKYINEEYLLYILKKILNECELIKN